MDYKKLNADVTTETRDLRLFDKETQNIYKSVAILSKRANQISMDLKEELNEKLEEFSSSTDNLEEIFENREQIEIARFYEQIPKPTLMAVKEFIDGKVYYRVPEEKGK